MLFANSQVKATRPEVLSILRTLQAISNAFTAVSEASEVGYESQLINKSIVSLPKIAADVQKFLETFDHHAAAKDDKYSFFHEVDQYKVISEHKLVSKMEKFINY